MRALPALAGLFWLGLAAHGAPAAHFTSPDESPFAVGEGHLHLRWSAGDEEFPPEGWRFRLEQSPDPGFEHGRVLYSGRDTGTFTSGLPAGATYFRIRAEEMTGEAVGPWSDTLEIQVKFPEWWLVALLVGSGIVLALVLLFTIILGSRRANREMRKEEPA